MDVCGIELSDLPDGSTPLELVLSMKVLSADGDVALVERMSRGLGQWEALGMAVTLTDSLRASLMHTDD